MVSLGGGLALFVILAQEVCGGDMDEVLVAGVNTACVAARATGELWGLVASVCWTLGVSIKVLSTSLVVRKISPSSA